MLSDEPIVIAEGHMRDLVHRITGPQRVVGPLADLSDTPSGHRFAAPSLGQHTREVLAEFGFSAEEIEGFVSAGSAFTAE